MKDIKVRRMTRENITFMNALRSEVSEHLHCNQKFSLNESYEWFDKNNPLFYMINYKDADVGYFRTSDYSQKNKSINIGADILPSHWGRGIAYLAYKEFIPLLFEELKLNRIALEVLSTNKRAYGLYKKLGFTEEGIKRDEVFRDGKYIDSIIMSILKREWNES